MVEFTINTKQAQSFFSSFGANVDDLEIVVSSLTLEATIAFHTHYFKKSCTLDGNVKTAGMLKISELSKVCQFIKTVKTDNVTLKQTGSGKTLYVIAGTSKLQLPVNATIISHSRVHLVKKMLDKTIASKWESFNNKELTIRGEIEVDDLMAITKMKGILNKPSFKIFANAEEKEFCVKAGKNHEARLFTSTVLTNPVGPNKTIESNFGPWLMTTLSLLNGGEATVHMGEATPLIVRQNDDLLIVVNQGG